MIYSLGPILVTVFQLISALESTIQRDFDQIGVFESRMLVTFLFSYF